jgi:hypothetical protein
MLEREKPRVISWNSREWWARWNFLPLSRRASNRGRFNGADTTTFLLPDKLSERISEILSTKKRADQMSASGPKRTSIAAPHMSAFGGKADITTVGWTRCPRRNASNPPCPLLARTATRSRVYCESSLVTVSTIFRVAGSTSISMPQSWRRPQHHLSLPKIPSGF